MASQSVNLNSLKVIVSQILNIGANMNFNENDDDKSDDEDDNGSCGGAGSSDGGGGGGGDFD